MQVCKSNCCCLDRQELGSSWYIQLLGTCCVYSSLLQSGEVLAHADQQLLHITLWFQNTHTSLKITKVRRCFRGILDEWLQSTHEQTRLSASYRNSTPQLGRMTFHACNWSCSHNEYIRTWHGKLVIVWQLLVTTPDLTQPTQYTVGVPYTQITRDYCNYEQSFGLSTKWALFSNALP